MEPVPCSVSIGRVYSALCLGFAEFQKLAAETDSTSLYATWSAEYYVNSIYD